MECDFQEGLCTWTQDTTDRLDWTRIKGPTQTGTTGPTYDHSYMNSSGMHGIVHSPEFLSSRLLTFDDTGACKKQQIRLSTKRHGPPVPFNALPLFRMPE